MMGENEPVATMPEQQPGPTKLLFNRREAGELLGVSPGTIDNLVKRGQLRPVYIGRLPRFTLAELQRYCRELERSRPVSEPSVELAE